MNGFSFAGRGQNPGLVFVRMKDWDERSDADLKVQALVRAHLQALRRLQGRGDLPGQSAVDSANSARPRASTSSCRIAAASATTS